MTNLKQGQSIVEVVIAATLISIGIIAALSLSNYSAKQNTYSKALSVATDYNSQVADWLRSERTKLGWATMVEKLSADAGGGVATYCLTALPANSSSFTDLVAGACNPSSDFIYGTTFVRELAISTSDVANGKISATVTTSWEEKTIRRSTLILELSQWQ